MQFLSSKTLKSTFIIGSILLAGLGLEGCNNNEPQKEDKPLEDKMYLTTQEEVNDFDPRDKMIALYISGEEITDLTPISIGEIETFVIEGTGVKDLMCEVGKVTKDLTIMANDKLETVAYLGISSCSGDILVKDNLILRDISAIDDIAEMTGKLKLINNPMLERPGGGKDYKYSEGYQIIDGKITEEVLNNYLGHAITEAEYLSNKAASTDGYYGTEDDERMLLNIGAKFVGRAIYSWNKELYFTDNYNFWLEGAKEKIDRIHESDPDIIFQAGMFETVSTKVNYVPIPSWVFTAFGKNIENRCFSFDKIKNRNGTYVGQWGEGTCVPDMSNEETQMWFYFMACRYMDAGCEALHFGQVNLMSSMGDSASGYPGFRKVLGMIREAAKTKTRRGFVLIDAHTAGIAVGGQLLFDYAAYPIRLKEVAGSTKMEAVIQKGYIDTIIGRTASGNTPSGWYTSRVPYFVEFDNFGTSNHAGTASNDHFIWGYDEISWISNVSEEYASEFVTYAYNWFKTNDPMGHLEMPGLRGNVGAKAGVPNPYRCNMKSENCPTGRNLENTIKHLWESE